VRLSLWLVLGWILAHCGNAQGQQPIPELWPEDAIRRSDLFGREVVVDGRIAFLKPSPGIGYDLIVFRNADDLTVQLPKRLAFSSLPRATSGRVRGLLKREGTRVVLDVSTVDLFVDDRQRLDSAIARLGPNDAASRWSWAKWAEQRAEHYSDAKLKERGLELETEALRIEGNGPAGKQADTAWALALRGKTRGLPGPEPAALAHHALRLRLSKAKTEAEIQAIQQDAVKFFEGGPPAQVSDGGEDLNRWIVAYAQEPAEAYRKAPDGVRGMLDRRLIADLSERWLRMKLGKLEPLERLRTIEETAPQLKDRPDVVDQLWKSAFEALLSNLGQLRQSEVTALARRWREAEGHPQEAQVLLRTFLEEQQRKKLAANDATGRVLLADQYVQLLDDRRTAAELLKEAWRIAPGSEEVEIGFRRIGYVKSGDTYQPATGPEPANDAPTAPAGSQTPARTARPPGEDPLSGLTPDEIRQQLGAPNAITRTVTQGEILEQWIYEQPQKQVILILRRPRSPVATVLGRFLLK
jgi:hypothetical protein